MDLGSTDCFVNVAFHWEIVWCLGQIIEWYVDAKKMYTYDKGDQLTVMSDFTAFLQPIKWMGLILSNLCSWCGLISQVRPIMLNLLYSEKI